MSDRKEAGAVRLSVVVPVYNEEGSIGKLFGEILDMCRAGLDGVPFDYEILVVNDGSSDGTDKVCRGLAPLRYIRFPENRGQTAAMDCGFHQAKGELIAALDGDGQNDPADIPNMVRYLLAEDLDAVSGWRRDRKDTFGKRTASRMAYLARQILLRDGIHDSGCTLKVYRRECFEGWHLKNDWHRFIPALLKQRGFRVGEIEVHHRPRSAGHTKYNITRGFYAMRDMLAIRRLARKKAETEAGRRKRV